MKVFFHHFIAAGIVFLAPLMVLGVAAKAAASEKQTTQISNCDIQKGACVQKLGEGSVILDILPRPVKAMTDLTFHVALKNISPTGEPAIDLGMPGMSMGPNHVLLHKTVEGLFSGTGLIVRCRSGKTLWEAKVDIPGYGTAVFTFHVIY